jgi:CheY-like chemotaxis protein
VVVEVSDSGIGIEPEALGRIFTAFEQADERIMTRQFGGLGLGLPISRALIEMHGGSIVAQSPGQNQGATFTVRLPVQAADEQELRRTDHYRPGHMIGASRLRILLVEDHGDTARIIAHLLRRAGHEVRLAGDMAGALAEAEQNDFDLLLCDIGLPDRSGLELLPELRARGKQFPAIALTGFGQEEDVRRTREAGFMTHLTKPIDVAQLQSAIVTFSALPASHSAT